MKADVEVSAKPVETVDTLLGENSSFSGDIEFSGGLRIDGIVRGHVTALDNANGLLVISETGEVEGDITVPHIIINGTVHGNVISSEHVELQKCARITGDIQYQGVEMQLGANLNGNLVSNRKSPVRAVPSTSGSSAAEPPTRGNSKILKGKTES
ncbi:MAG: polymer-forming cytoskeletal protein [Proteobacteria bacterium]|nr:polymer-forming cytoskeletal protein [Pseudomonadota bacterium]